MKASRIPLLLTACIVTQILLLPTAILAVSDKYEVELNRYAEYVEAVSGGFAHGNRVRICVGSHTFYDNVPHGPETAGLYVVAILKDKVLLKHHYNTYLRPWASEDLADDIRELPQGTFVVVAAKDEPTRYFSVKGQTGLYQIGASTGLLKQKFRTSYLCIGVKGLARGKAIEKVEMKEFEHKGSQAAKHLHLAFGTSEKHQIPTTMDPNSDGKFVIELDKYASCSEVVSSGPGQGDHLLIRIGKHTFYDSVLNCRPKAGLYVVAVLEDEVLLQRHYNTYLAPGASLGLALDMSKLPNGTFVAVAANNDATRFLDKAGQEALKSVGAEIGFLKIDGASYFCLGVKGLECGKAIENLGMEESKYVGPEVGKHIEFAFPQKPEPPISKRPGRHEGLMIGETEAIYYIPENFNLNTAQYLFCIHGAGAYHRPGAMTHIANFGRIADVMNLVVVAPAFDHIFNRPVNRRKDLIEGTWKDPRIIKDLHLHHMSLLNGQTDQRADLKLIEIFEYFNRKLMKREKFHLYGHSGGAQFVSRFIVFHPQLIDKVALSSAGSFLFPRRDIDFPYGLKMDNLDKTFGPHIKADDLRLSHAELDQKLNKMLDLKFFIVAGEKETVQENRPERNWQGKSTLEKAQNFYKAMKEEDKRLKDAGLRSRSKPFKFELHVMPGVGHHAGKAAKKTIDLLFPTVAMPGVFDSSAADVLAQANATDTTSRSAHGPSGTYLQILEEYANRTKVVSGGYRGGNRVHIQIDDHSFYINMPAGPDAAGLYVVAIYENEVLLQSHYNTYKRAGATGRMAKDIAKLPYCSFVVVAAKDEPTRFFDEQGQQALYQIGAQEGLLGQAFRTSYFCLGVKGLERGKAIEKIGLDMLVYTGEKVDEPVKFSFPKRQEPKVTAGFFKIYDPSIGEEETWAINDHCFIRGRDGTWHMFGITGTEPHNPIYGSVFAHATAANLTQIPWHKEPFPLKADPKAKEVHLWAPHIIFHNETYHMYYCAGSDDRTRYRIHLATSKDLYKWHRHPENPMIVDGFDARDPFILRVGDEWVVYYTATSTPSGGNHVVACQTSQDLIHWKNRRIVFVDPSKGTSAGPTESPTVVRRGECYYLFIGPRGGYAGTDVFCSGNPFEWDLEDKVGHIRAHAAEVIRDVDGKWYASHCGRGQGGVYLAHLYWNDGLDDADTSLPIPK